MAARRSTEHRPVLGQDIAGTLDGRCVMCGKAFPKLFVDACRGRSGVPFGDSGEERHCGPCRVDCSRVPTLAAHLQRLSDVRAAQARIFADGEPPTIRFVGRAQVDEIRIGKLPDGTTLRLPGFQVGFHGVPAARERLTRGLVLGAESPFPRQDIFQKYVENSETLLGRCPDATVHVIVGRSEESVDQGLLGLQTACDGRATTVPHAVVDLSADTSRGPRGPRGERAYDRLLASAYDAPRYGGGVGLTKRHGPAHGMCRNGGDIRWLETFDQYTHVEVDVAHLEKKYGDTIRLVEAGVPHVKAPVEVPTFYAQGHGGKCSRRIGKPVLRHHPARRRGYRVSHHDVCRIVCANEVAYDHAIRTMRSRARAAAVWDLMVPDTLVLSSECAVAGFPAFRAPALSSTRSTPSNTSTVPEKCPRHLDGLRQCFRRVLSSGGGLVEARAREVSQCSRRGTGAVGAQRLLHEHQCRVLPRVEAGLAAVARARKEMPLSPQEQELLLEIVLLELKCTTGQTTNFFPTALHRDGNTTEAFETCSAHWRGRDQEFEVARRSPKGESGCHKADIGGLVLPGPQVVVAVAPHEGVVHVHLVTTVHASSPGRGARTCVRLCGPRGYLNNRKDLRHVVIS